MKRTFLIVTTVLLMGCASVFADISTTNGALNVTDSVYSPVVTATTSLNTDTLKASEIVEFQGKLLKVGTLTDTNWALVEVVRNKAGAAIYKGDVVMWDTTEIAFDTCVKTTGALKTEADSFGIKPGDEGYPVAVYFRVIGTANAGDSIRLYGTKFNESAVSSERWYMGTGANPKFASGYLWDDIDSVSIRDADGGSLTSVVVNGYSLGGVEPANAYSRRVAGIVYSDSITDNSTGYIVVQGRCLADVEPGTTIMPGDPLWVNARSNLVEVTEADSVNNVFVIGKALTPLCAGGTGSTVDSGLIWIELGGK